MSNHIQTTHCIELFVCLGLRSLFNIWGHIVTVPACSSGTLTNVLPHRNAMLQTQDMTPHSLTLYGHGPDLSLCYPLMWNVTLEYTATHFNGLGKTRPGNPSPTFFTPANVQLYDAVMGVISRELSSKYCTTWTLNLWCENPLQHRNITCVLLIRRFTSLLTLTILSRRPWARWRADPHAAAASCWPWRVPWSASGWIWCLPSWWHGPAHPPWLPQTVACLPAMISDTPLQDWYWY